MRVKDAMSAHVKIANPSQSIREAARLMAELDCGCLPVGEEDRLVGMVTDRDIAVRAVAEGMSLKTPIREIMSLEVKYCFEDAELDEVAQNMADIKVRRLPVLDHNKDDAGRPRLDRGCGLRRKRAERDFLSGRRAFAIRGGLRRGEAGPFLG